MDYVVTVAKVGVRSNVTQIDYHISLDMAKHISMMEKTAKGKEARDHFIRCEKELRQQVGPATQIGKPDNRRLALMVIEEVDRDV